jgi:anti-sigma regulatory factor (Ser/Thr protein kinase)
VSILAHRRFEPTPESVVDARRFVEGVLGAAPQVAEEVVEAARLVVSELATNAVLHARTAFDVSVADADGLDGLVISVADHDPTWPVLADAAPDALGGRGILLVDRTAAGWGVEPDGDGKRVWCRLGERHPHALAGSRV